MKVSDGGSVQISEISFQHDHLCYSCNLILLELYINDLYSKCLLYDQMLDCKQEKDDVQPQASPEGTSAQVLRDFLVVEHQLSSRFLHDKVFLRTCSNIWCDLCGAEFDPPDRSELAGTGENGNRRS